jgi:hypothetical protein
MSFLNNVKSRVFGGSVNDLTVQEADVSDELAAAGRAFGTLMEQVGLAVAETQRELDKNGAAIAEIMCTTDVEMIRARETFYDDDGNVKDIRIVTGIGKLIELASPVFYEHKFVALQGEFTAKELATSTQTKVRQAGASASGSIGPASGKANKFGSKKTSKTGSASASVSASFSDVTAGTSFDSSVGTMRMNALIAPKDSIGIPKPPLILVGPKITITSGSTATSESPALDAGSRNTIVTITVKTKDGATVNKGQVLSIDTGGIDWTMLPSLNPLSLTNVPAPIQDAPQTDDIGVVKIQLKRTLTPGSPPLESKKAAVTVRLGLVTATATVTV